MARIAALALLCLSIAAVGCGGDEDEPDSPAGTPASSSETAPTREEFIAQGDAICKDANEEIAEINSGETGASTLEEGLEQLARVAADGYEVTRGYVGEFRDLTPPEGDEETVDKIVSGLEQQAGIIGQLADAADSGDTEQFQQITPQVQEIRNRVRSLLQGYGFDDCGSGDSAER